MSDQGKQPKPLSGGGNEKTAVVSEYVGVPKIQCTTYMKSIYAWLGGAPVPVTAPATKGAPVKSSPEDTIPITSANRIGVHPSQRASTDAVSNEDPTTVHNFSDLSSSSPTRTANTVTARASAVAGEFGEPVPKIPPSSSSTMEAAVATAEQNSKSESDEANSCKTKTGDVVQFSFMNQLHQLEEQKNKDFLIPDADYFGNREKALEQPVHAPDSTAPPRKLQPPPPPAPQSSGIFGSWFGGFGSKKKEEP